MLSNKVKICESYEFLMDLFYFLVIEVLRLFEKFYNNKIIDAECFSFMGR